MKSKKVINSKKVMKSKKVISKTIIGYLKNYLRKWFFKEPWFERFLVEPEMVLLWHHSKELFSVPDGTLTFPCA